MACTDSMLPHPLFCTVSLSYIRLPDIVANPYERTGTRHAAQPLPRAAPETRVREVTLQAPKVRKGSYFAVFVEPDRRGGYAPTTDR